MNGFVEEAEEGRECSTVSTSPKCSPCKLASAGEAPAGSSQCSDVMGYHDARDIPNYWTYAHEFVLQDHMFGSVSSWSLPSHLYIVSGWSAYCTEASNPYSCSTNIELPNKPHFSETNPQYAWTDLTWLLHRQNVSWGYYIFNGEQPECLEDPLIPCEEPGSSTSLYPGQSTAGTGHTPAIWDSLKWFTDVREDNQFPQVQSISNFFAAAKAGTLPAVSWLEPSFRVSEHPPALISEGQRYVTGLINAIMESPDWNSTAIFVSWDDWGGFYDSVVPPVVDANGYGLRVPGLVISPYAKHGYIDHQTLSHDAYLKFIENDFLGGERLNPTTDGRPDPRPDVREESPVLGELTSDFEFGQAPRPPVLLPLSPAPGPASTTP
jgi:phospholipase C